MHVFLTYFGLPDGAVWSNLIASALWAAPALWHLHRKLTRHHTELKQVLPCLPRSD